MLPEPKSEFPFPVREPEVYRADVIVTTGGAEERFFIARNGASWRRDHFDGGVRSFSEMRSADGVYLIDHKRKLYAVEPAAGNEVAGFGAASVSFYRGKEYREFDETGRGDGVVHYAARKIETSQDDILIDVDEASGMIVRQVFTSPDGSEGFVYELTDLKLETDDTLFRLPAGYRKVSIDQLRTALKKK